MLAKIGPAEELELADAGGLVLLEDLGAGDVRGHQVGRELDAVEGQVQRIGQRADHQRLGQAGHADQQAVAAGEDGDQQLLDHLCWPTITLPISALRPVKAVLEPLDGGQVVALERFGGFSVRCGVDVVASLTRRSRSLGPAVRQIETRSFSQGRAQESGPPSRPLAEQVPRARVTSRAKPPAHPASS